MTRTCTKCGETKPLDQYYRNSQASGGYVSKCKICYRADVSLNRRRNIEHYREHDRKRAMRPDRVAMRLVYLQSPEGLEASARAKRDWAERNPEKRAAHVIVGNAIRDGRLVKQPCERCGAAEVQAHHEDYSRPLEVRWLCVPCHHAEHTQEPGPSPRAYRQLVTA